MNLWWVVPLIFATISGLALMAFCCGFGRALRDLRRTDRRRDEQHLHTDGERVNHALHLVTGDAYARIFTFTPSSSSSAAAGGGDEHGGAARTGLGFGAGGREEPLLPMALRPLSVQLQRPPPVLKLRVADASDCRYKNVRPIHTSCSSSSVSNSMKKDSGCCNSGDNSSECGEEAEPQSTNSASTASSASSAASAAAAGSPTCAVCLDAFRPGQRLAAGALCQHWMHEDCLLQWLAKDRFQLCPICRTSMAADSVPSVEQEETREGETPMCV